MSQTYPGAQEIDRTRAGFRRRMREIDKLNTSSTQELKRVMAEWVGLARDDMRLLVVSQILKCFGRLVLRTPVDTGRARAAWQISTSVSSRVPAEGEYPDYKRDGTLEGAIREALPPLDSLTKSDVIYIMNNVEYILALDAGWSSKQPGGFIGLFLQELRMQLEQAAALARGIGA